LNKKILIIGAGPAGLTAALELLNAGESDVTILEASDMIGGISRTVKFKGNRIDIGGHRFFSKSDWVTNWRTKILPASYELSSITEFKYQGNTRTTLPSATGFVAEDGTDNVMLLRSRISRIYYNRKFFDYPLKLNLESLAKLGVEKTILFGLSYFAAKLRPIKKEKSLEEFLINRFGKKLYRQFFKEYTEKVWGVHCSEISAEWGAQRIKSLSVGTALIQAFLTVFVARSSKPKQTSLIESFMYPKFGPGQMWEVAALQVIAKGGRILLNRKVSGIDLSGKTVKSLEVAYGSDGNTQRFDCTHLVSTMPIKDLFAASRNYWPVPVLDVAKRLEYRDFITVGLLYPADDMAKTLSDNWIYIQEPGVHVGRVQVFNNWSPHMVADPTTMWLGLEYFCKETDDLWQLPDAELIALAEREMAQINLVSVPRAKDGIVIRVPKAYPGYFGAAYQRFDEVREALDAVDNLFPIGRNGMHRYNNQDHSMLTAKEAAAQIVSGLVDKKKIWDINIGDDYHEELVPEAVPA
jgi:protoporphyrinogen oxidase